MNTITWTDWIIPSNPFAATVSGLIVMAVVAVSYWYETRQVKGPMIVFLVGALVVVVGAQFLKFVGFYG